MQGQIHDDDDDDRGGEDKDVIPIYDVSLK
jgi:hypothetical protein